jgi:hypothetical protein
LESTTPPYPTSSHSGPVTSRTPTSSYSTSTVYTYSVSTITHCASTVTNCPAESYFVTTHTIAVSTTVCPVTEESTPPPYPTSKPHGHPTPPESSSPGGYPIPPESSSPGGYPTPSESSSPGGYSTPPESSHSAGYTTSTVYSTYTYMISSCAPTVTNCPYGSVTTETVEAYTTVCPVTETETPGAPVTPTVTVQLSYYTPGAAGFTPLPGPSGNAYSFAPTPGTESAIPYPSYSASAPKVSVVTVIPQPESSPAGVETHPAVYPTSSPAGIVTYPVPAGTGGFAPAGNSTPIVPSTPVYPSAPVQVTGGAAIIMPGTLMMGVLAAALVL